MPANASRTPWRKPQRRVPRVTSHQATKGNVPAVPITGGPAFRPEDLPRRWPQPAARRWFSRRRCFRFQQGSELPPRDLLTHLPSNVRAWDRVASPS